MGAPGPFDTLGEWRSPISAVIASTGTTIEEIAEATGLDPDYVSRVIRIAELIADRGNRHRHIRTWLDAREAREAAVRGNAWQAYIIDPRAEEDLGKLGPDARASVEELASTWHAAHKRRAADPFIPVDTPISVPRRVDSGLLRVMLRHRFIRTDNQGAPVYRLEVAGVDLVGEDTVKRQVIKALNNGAVKVRVPSGRSWEDAVKELAFTILAVLPYATGQDARPIGVVRLVVEELAIDHAIPLADVARALDNVKRRRIEASMGWGDNPEDWSTVNEGEALKLWAHQPESHFTESHHIAKPWLSENIGLLDGEATWLFERSDRYWRKTDGNTQILRDTRRKLAFEVLVQDLLVAQGILTRGPCKGFRVGRKRQECADPYGPWYWLNHDKPRQHRGKPHHLESMCPECNRSREKLRNARKSRESRKRATFRVTGSLD